MATELHNPLGFDSKDLPTKKELSKQKYTIIVADWNSDITYPMLEGAYCTLVESGVKTDNIEVLHVPGAVELTYAAAMCMHDSIADDKKLSAIIVIGCVIKGDTPHFDYVCQSVTAGITQLNAKGDIPIVFSVLTTLDKQQALDRAGGRLGNKGVEGAYTAIKMANLIVDSYTRE